MTRTNRMDAINNRMRQEKFADSLIACLGVEGAIRACRANVWDGVLGLVLQHKRCPGPANHALDLVGHRTYTVAYSAVR